MGKWTLITLGATIWGAFYAGVFLSQMARENGKGMQVENPKAACVAAVLLMMVGSAGLGRSIELE